MAKLANHEENWKIKNRNRISKRTLQVNIVVFITPQLF